MSTNILGLKPDRLLNALAAEQEEEAPVSAGRRHDGA